MAIQLILRIKMLFNKKKITYLFTFIFSFNSFAICKDTFYSHANYLDFEKKELTIFPLTFSESEANSLKLKNISNDLEIISKIINEQGIKSYVTLALNGSAPDKIKMFGQEMNVFDIAILNSADTSILIELLNKNYPVGQYGLKALLTRYDSSFLSKVLPILQIDFFEQIIIDDERQYTAANYLLKKMKIDNLTYLYEKGFIDSNSFQDKTLVGIDNLTIIQRQSLSQLLDIPLYINNFEIQQSEQYLNASIKKDFELDYKHHYLVELCINDYNNIHKGDVVFGSGFNKLQTTLEKLELTTNSNIDIVSEKLNSTINTEYVLKLKNDQLFNDYKIKRVKDFSSISNNDPKVIYINQKGLTYQEFQLLKGKVIFDVNDPRIRLEKIAKHFPEYKSLNLMNKLTKSKDLIQARYLAKNLTHYALLYWDDKKDVTWAINTFGSPKADYGLNFKDKILITSFYSEYYKENKKNIMKMFPKIKAHKEIINTYRSHKSHTSFTL